MMDADPEVRRFMGGPLDPDVHRKEVLSNIIAGRPEHRSWAIEWKDHAGFLGMCLIRPVEGTGFTCLGWRLMRQHWGQGVATEAACAVLDHALHVLGINPVVAIVDPRNLASIRVAEKIGFLQVGGACHYGTQQIFFRADAANALSPDRAATPSLGWT
jgi:RimJ/RimL family protein N-acetyltransferase